MMTFARYNPAEQAARNEARKQANLQALCTPARASTATMQGGTTGKAIDKENAIQSEAYMSVVRALACRRCGYIPGYGYPRNQFAHADQGKGQGIKTDCRRGASLCGPHDRLPGCHWILGTSGQIPKAERRRLEDQYAASTRAEVLRLGLWPKGLPRWTE